MTKSKLLNVHCLQCNYNGLAGIGKRAVSKTPYGAGILIFSILGIFFTPFFIVVLGLFLMALFAWVHRVLGIKPSICPKCKSAELMDANTWHSQNS